MVRMEVGGFLADGLVGLVWAPVWVAQLFQGGRRARGERLGEQCLTSGGQFAHVDQVPCPAGLLLWVAGAGGRPPIPPEASGVRATPHRKGSLVIRPHSPRESGTRRVHNQCKNLPWAM